MPTQLICKRCKLPIEAKDVLEEVGIAKCRSCGAVMDLLVRASSSASSGPSERHAAGRPPVDMPEKFKLDRGSGSLSIEWRWFTPATVGLIAFCVIWDGFLVQWYASAFKSRDVVAFVFPILHLAAGVVISWIALCGIFNSTRVSVEQRVLRIRHFPLPWPGNRELSTDDLEQLYSCERVHKGKNGTTYTYELMAILRNTDKRLKLVSGLQKAEQALFLEQSLESFLHIEDEPVVGELPKTG